MHLANANDETVLILSAADQYDVRNALNIVISLARGGWISTKRGNPRNP